MLRLEAMVAGAMGKEKMEVKKRGSPISPRRIMSMASSVAGLGVQAIGRHQAGDGGVAAAIIASHSATVTASGFSTSAWMPALAARIE